MSLLDKTWSPEEVPSEELYQTRTPTAWLAISLATLLLSSLVIVAIGVRGNGVPAATPSGELTVYCAASMREPMQRIADRFEEEHHTRIQLQFGGSNTLLSQIRLTGIGDVYVAAAASYVEEARRQGLVEDSFGIAEITPVIVLRSQAAAEVTDLRSLIDSDLRIALADPYAAAVGRATKKALEQAGFWNELEDKVAANGVFQPTVNTVAGSVALGAVDAGIVWDANAYQYADLRVLPAEELQAARSKISIAALETTKDASSADAFVAFAAHDSFARERFFEHGFTLSDRLTRQQHVSEVR